LDPANATYPMFDLQTGVPMNPVADKMKEDSRPKREFDVVPPPERVSAPGKVKPSNALSSRRSIRQSRRAARAAQNLEAAPGSIQGHSAHSRNSAVRGPAMTDAAQPMAEPSRAAPRGIDRKDARAEAETAESAMRGAAADALASPEVVTENVRPVPRTIQAAPGAIPASTVGEPAGGGWPVKGEVVSSYGRQADDAWNTGVSLAAAPLSPVVAPMAGTVAFAGEKDGVGHMVLAHGNGLTSHYANVTPTLAQGEAVQAGMEFARVAAGDGFSAAETAEAMSRMRFEVRRGELAINPNSLLA
ncbi:MAG: peptidoglycan DD-metalloendopeptidase family protein, partial [Deltaproteobacteria bacterium]|nr:peptidoglycan DD-metalloendopeptidase family protein [Deltaproteobacteria bacterium]